MNRVDLRWPSATRVEVDQRSREARLRQGQLERLLVLRIIPRQSRLGRVLFRFGLRISRLGEGPGTQTPNATVTGPKPRPRPKMQAETGVAARLCTAAPSPAVAIGWGRRAA